MSVYFIPGEPKKLLKKIFLDSNPRYLKFGPCGRTKNPSNFSELRDTGTKFIDYVMEGSVSYCLRVAERPDGLEIYVEGDGSNRSQYLDWLIEFNISCSGFVSQDGKNT